jgi:hypothetical protein
MFCVLAGPSWLAALGLGNLAPDQGAILAASHDFTAAQDSKQQD